MNKKKKKSKSTTSSFDSISVSVPRKLMHNTAPNPGVYSGTKFVKKAGMRISYVNYNTPNKTDSQEWF